MACISLIHKDVIVCFFLAEMKAHDQSKELIKNYDVLVNKGRRIDLVARTSFRDFFVQQAIYG